MENVLIGYTVFHVESSVVASVHYDNLCLRAEGAEFFEGEVVFFLYLEILGVVISVMMEKGDIQFRAHELVLDSRLERIIILVVYI